jgi:hypothetical protein
MPAISIRDIPVPLYETLKKSASANHRSLNKEVIVALEAHALKSRKEPILGASERAAMMAQILRTAPPIDKHSADYQMHEDDILGYGPNGPGNWLSLIPPHWSRSF